MANNLFFVCAFILASFYGGANADNQISKLSCNFTLDFCNWETKTEAMNPSEFDIGWRIYSPHLDGGQYKIPENGDRFAYASGQDDFRTFLNSPMSDLDPRLITVSFRYATTGSATLILYVISDSGHKYIWTSNSNHAEQAPLTADIKNSTTSDFNETTSVESETSIEIPVEVIAESSEPQWKTEITSPVCQIANVPRLFQLSFVAYVKVNESVAISNVVTNKLDSIPEDCTGNVGESHDDNDITTAWKFFIVFCLFVCFGAIFITTLLIIGRTSKTIHVPANIERSQHQDYPNPSFKYRRLKDIVNF